jgi:hypothetical protein
VQKIHRASDSSEAVAAYEPACRGGIDIASASDSSTVKKIQAWSGRIIGTPLSERTHPGIGCSFAEPKSREELEFVTTKMLAVTGFGSKTELSGLSSLALAAGMVSASLLLATITYYAVEKAGRRYLRSLLGVRGALRPQKSPSVEPHRAYR